MSDDYDDLLAEMAKLGRLEIQPSVVIWSDEDEVDLNYRVGGVGLVVTVKPDRTLRAWIPTPQGGVIGWDAVAKHLHSNDPQARVEKFTEPLDTLRRHLEGQVWLLRLLLEMR